MDTQSIATLDIIAGWDDLNEERRVYWDHMIQEHRIPSLFTGQCRGMESLEACDGRELRDRIRRDPLLATKLLSVANSTRSGQRNPVRSVDRAFNQLGLDLVLAIVLTYEMENELQEGIPVSRQMLHHVRNQASLSHCIAGIYAKELRLPDEEAFCNAALLNTVASLLLAHTPRFTEDVYLGFADELQRLHYEQETWGVSSPVLTRRMLQLWGLHEPVPELAGARHLPLLQRLGDSMPQAQLRQICLLAAVNALSQAYMQRQSVTPEILLNRRNYLILKQNLLDCGMYVPVGRYWGQRSTEHILRAAY